MGAPPFSDSPNLRSGDRLFRPDGLIEHRHSLSDQEVNQFSQKRPVEWLKEERQRNQVIDAVDDPVLVIEVRECFFHRLMLHLTGTSAQSR